MDRRTRSPGSASESPPDLVLRKSVDLEGFGPGPTGALHRTWDSGTPSQLATSLRIDSLANPPVAGALQETVQRFLHGSHSTWSVEAPGFAQTSTRVVALPCPLAMGSPTSCG